MEGTPNVSMGLCSLFLSAFVCGFVCVPESVTLCTIVHVSWVFYSVLHYIFILNYFIKMSYMVSFLVNV